MENPLMVSLILSKVNFDLILSGKKKTEYRDLSDRNLSLFVDDPFGGNPQFKPIKQVRFFEGYRKDRRCMVLEVTDIDIECLDGCDVIAVHLGDFLNQNN